MSDHIRELVDELRTLPAETETVEFKANMADPQAIGEYISALSNSAALAGRPFGYLVWGIDDSSHEVVGTEFVPTASKKGNEELENWLLRGLTPKINFEFIETDVDGRRVVLMRVDPASGHPVRFNGVEFIRVGSYKKKLKEYSNKERELWRALDQQPFESRIASDNLTDDDVLRLLDYASYFDLLESPIPPSREQILYSLQREKFITSSDTGRWGITNLGAILFAARLSDFSYLSRKAARVIQYRGRSRVETIKEQIGTKGYASGFAGLIGYLEALLPANEIVGAALRRTVPMYPALALRELLANALIHQSFGIGGTGPMVEIFDDRVEITSPGVPLMEPTRFLDSPPRSRNEALASMMRRIGVCEERGSGWDKVVDATELHQLPAPLVEVTEEHTRVTLFAPKPLSKMDKEERVRAVYWHACLRWVNREHVTNASVRARFAIDEHNKAQASRIIREALDEHVIYAYDPTAGTRSRSYVPFWAAGTSS